MQKSIFVYLLALFFLIGSLLFLSSFFLNTSSNQNKEIGDEVIFEAKNISINLNFKESDFLLKVKSSMVNSLKEEKNLYVFEPEILLSGKKISINLTSGKGKISYGKNTLHLEENITISGKVNKKNLEGNALGISIDLNNRSLFSENLVLFIDSYEISFNEINLDNDKMILKGEPIYLKGNDGTITTTSSIEIRSNGELVFPEKINVNSLN
tara:strand:+ start:15857 stop:16489 length:633 start_codon:yes stop_codon:yes gene_type:complete